MSSFLKTPKLTSPLNLVDDSCLIKDKTTCSLLTLPKIKQLDEHQVYGRKRLTKRMSTNNGIVFNDLFRHAEKCRLQNQVQEKKLKEYLCGNKGIEQKLHRSLTKIEKTRQVLEEELYYMEKEMIERGLNKATEKQSKNDENNSTDDELLKTYREKKSYWSRQSLPTTMPSSTPRRPSIPKRKGNSLVLSQDLATKFSQRFNNFLRETSFLRKNNHSQSNNLLSTSTNVMNDENMHDDLSSRSTKILILPNVHQIYQEKKRHNSLQKKVGFTKIDPDELNIPIHLKHSSDALDKYKFNPHYYLPDGTLKRKFSLPQLKDSLDAVKNCYYLRTKHTSSCDLNITDEMDEKKSISNLLDSSIDTKNTLS